MGRIEARMALLRATVLGLTTLAGPLTSDASPAAAGYDFKGLELGAPATAAQVEERLNSPCSRMDGTSGECDEVDARAHALKHVGCGPGLDGMTVCNGMTTVAGAPGRVNVVISAGGRLQRVMITELDSDSFDAVYAELQRKFGHPKVVARPIVQNGFGARFQQFQATWSDGQHRQVTISKYSGTTTESSLYFGTQQDQQMMNRAAEGVKGDL